MKIAIVAFSNPIYCPYINFYTDIMKNIDNCNYDVIYLKRFKDVQTINCSDYIVVNWVGKGTNAAGKIEKAFNFVRFRRKVSRLIKENKYDKIIVLTTMPAVLLSRFLQKDYYHRYIIDVRDYTKENSKWYFRCEECLVNNSALNVISSKGFLKFLPKAEYLICHNTKLCNTDNYIGRFEKKEKENIVIAYIGTIAYTENCLKLIKLVENDARFCFYFYGNESGKPVVSEYISTINNSRILYKGPFLPNQKPTIYSECDIVFNCYGNNTDLVRCAISNKYYDGALYGRPLLVSPGTIMAELGGKFSFPLDLDLVESLNTLYDWYQNIDPKEYNEYAKNVIKTSQEENDRTVQRIIKEIQE